MSISIAQCDHSRIKPQAIDVPLAWLELGIGGILLTITSYYLSDALSLPNPLNPNAVGAGRFPSLIAFATLACLVLMLCHSVVTLVRNKDLKRVKIRRPASVILAIVVLLAQVLLMEHLGAVACSVLFSMLLMFAAGERRPVQLLGVPLALGLSIYLVFTVALGVYFP